ncbi:hypothetical protein WJX81_002276 [Elliptochloris bilobata]|uniref:Very-long-chain (3R)-3-hydroxyacyl-CoA dehydratase n=1 Tax=Elliptochloris bilobata TaxID=381761 RepID=A0AAW1R030_9CHLO
MGNAYLLAYNSALTLGWGYVLFLTLKEVTAGGWSKEVYEATSVPLKISQTAAVLEIVHSVMGIVKSPFFTTFIQVLSRIWALWGLVAVAPEACSTGAVTLLAVGHSKLQLSYVTLMLCWSLSEILRYGFYAAKELGHVPYPLLWLRYSAFLVLYPFGVGSEMTMARLAMPVIHDRGLLSLRMPNALNYSFDYYWFCWVAVACYLPGLPQLYLYMLKQRKRVLGPASKPKAA